MPARVDRLQCSRKPAVEIEREGKLIPADPGWEGMKGLRMPIIAGV
jgi:hypothetical protein